MENLDAAHEAFPLLRSEIAGYANSVVTEADTRLKIIDRIFTEVLFWPLVEVLTESSTETGFADYRFSVAERARLIVEAKRDGAPFGLTNRAAGRGFKLSGAAFRASPVKEGIEQAIAYCGSKNAELACVTNGSEWVIFRGSRLGDGRDTRDGHAFVFPTLDSIEEHFAKFYDLLSYEGAIAHSFRAYFQEAEGQTIRPPVISRSLRLPGSARLLDGGELARDVEQVMVTFFDRLSGEDDPDLLPACFVETAESEHADAQLVRVAESLVGRIRSLDTEDAALLTELIRRATEKRRREFVIIVGTKGAGKSTFITRFFSTVLPQEVARQCVLTRVDLADSPGDRATVVEWLSRALLVAFEASVFKDAPPTFEEIEGMFFDDYTRLRAGTWARLYENDKLQFQIDFGKRIENLRDERPHDYILGIVRHVVRNRKKLPVIVFDNADHFDIAFQESVYQYTRSIYEETLCLVILPITDRTSWQLSRHGALQSFDQESLFLPTPPTEQVIERRIRYFEDRVETERQRPDDRYFIGRGISLSIADLAAFARSLQRIFIETGGVAHAIGNLANDDVRRALRITRNLATSPHIKIQELLSAYVADSAHVIPAFSATRALICNRYDIYPAGQVEFVQNVFWMCDEVHTTPLAGVRLLRLLKDARAGSEADPLVSVDQVFEYCEAMGIEARVTESILDAALRAGLCLNYDPTVTEVANATRVELSPSGAQHLEWSVENVDYLSAMADVTPIADENKLRTMRDAISDRGPGWRAKTCLFMEYLVERDAQYCVVPDHPAFSSQREVGTQLIRVMPVRSTFAARESAPPKG